MVSTSFGNVVRSVIAEAACATLPVSLKYFTARRNKTNVQLKWETVIEENNTGFVIERKAGNGDWETVAFVTSKAVNGTSSSPITYEFNDLNTIRGISQYRLKQVDIDGKFVYSPVRSVRGDGQKGKTIVYPNPSNDGKINIVFEDVDVVRDVSVIDMSGRTIRQWKGVTNNNIQVDNLSAGFYTVRIIDTETGEQAVEKFVVNKR